MTATDPDVEATLARLEQHVTDLEAERAQLREAFDAAEARRDDLARRILRMKEEADAAHTDCWVPIPLRWRHVQPGDIVALKDKAWEVTAINPGIPEQQIEVTVVRGAKLHEARLDADATVPVLVRHQEREALQTARAQLGATVVDRRV